MWQDEHDLAQCERLLSRLGEREMGHGGGIECSREQSDPADIKEPTGDCPDHYFRYGATARSSSASSQRSTVTGR